MVTALDVLFIHINTKVEFYTFEKKIFLLLIEGDSMADYKGKKFVYPENVESSYGFFLGITLKELLVTILPISAIGIVLLALPPRNVWLMLVKFTLLILVLVVVVAFLASRPVASRKNIRYQTILKLKGAYAKRQKRFFIAEKKK